MGTRIRTHADVRLIIGEMVSSSFCGATRAGRRLINGRKHKDSLSILSREAWILTITWKDVTAAVLTVCPGDVINQPQSRPMAYQSRHIHRLVLNRWLRPACCCPPVPHIRFVWQSRQCFTITRLFVISLKFHRSNRVFVYNSLLYRCERETNVIMSVRGKGLNYARVCFIDSTVAIE